MESRPAPWAADGFPTPAASSRRQVEAEESAVPAGSDQRELAAMAVHQLLRDGEAEAGAAGPSRAGEGLEQVLARLLRQARPIVGAVDLDPAVGRPGAAGAR